tara:strand:+ start:429 stop:1289 length:861 start_codon:yes stop_codon:yes gene_type:complete
MKNKLKFSLALFCFVAGLVSLIITAYIISVDNFSYINDVILNVGSTKASELIFMLLSLIYAPIFSFYLAYRFFKSSKGKDFNQKNKDKKTRLKFRILKITAIVLGITSLLGNILLGFIFIVFTNLSLFASPPTNETQKTEKRERNIRIALSDMNLNLKENDYILKNYDAKSVFARGTVKVDFSLKIDSTKKDYIINQIRNTDYFGTSANTTMGETRYNINLENPELFLWNNSSDSLQYYKGGHFIWKEGSNTFGGYIINSGSRDYHTEASFNPKSGILKYRYISNW